MHMHPLRLSLFALLLLAVLGLSQEAEASSVTGIEYPDGKIYRTGSYEINVTVDNYQEVQQRWLGDIEWRMRLVKPIILLLDSNNSFANPCPLAHVATK